MAKNTGSGLTTIKYNITSDLEKIVGKGPMTRPNIVKGIWAYIKKNKLQGAKNKRMIEPDSTLAKVTGGTSFDMLKLAGKLSSHIKEKA